MSSRAKTDEQTDGEIAMRVGPVSSTDLTVRKPLGQLGILCQSTDAHTMHSDDRLLGTIAIILIVLGALLFN